MSRTPASATRPACRVAVLALLIFAAFAQLGPASALAGRKQAAGASSPLSLMRESTWNSPNPNAPGWCLNEDDWHQRTWSGALSGSLTASERLCDGNVDYSGGIWWDGGGVGVQADLYVTGTLESFVLKAPTGETRSGVLVGSSTSKGSRTDHYQVCFVPAFSISSNVGGHAIPGGMYDFTVSGSLKSVNYVVTAEMADAPFQQQRCPAEQQNLVP